jgi:hypothetical protein
MNRLVWRSVPRRLSMGLALALALVAQAPGTARADSLRPDSPLFRLDLTWAASLVPLPSAPADAREPPPLLSFDDAPNQLFSLETTSPGLQFSLDPDNEEILLGWQFEF